MPRCFLFHALLLFGGVLFAGAAFGADSSAGAVRATEPVTVPLAAIRELTPDVLARQPPVCVRGIVTWVSDIRNIAIQDESGGAWIHMDEARQKGIWESDVRVLTELREGMEVLVRGVAAEGGYSPLVLPRTIEVLGIKPLPAALLLDRGRFFAGFDNGRRGAIRAVVRSFQPGSVGWRLQLDANPGLFTALVTTEVVKDPRSLVDAEVLIAGVIGSVFNTRGEMIMPQLRTRIVGDVRVEKPAPRIEEVPEVPLRGLMGVGYIAYPPHRVRLHGTVISVQRGYMYLQEGDRSVRVEGALGQNFSAGDEVVALGFVDMTRNVARLVGAECHKVGAEEIPEPETVSVRTILELNKEAAARGIPARPHDYDGHLIRTVARLLAVQSHPAAGPTQRLILEQEGFVFNAMLEEGEAASFEALQPGSLLHLTGIVMLGSSPEEIFTRQYRATQLDLLLRSPADVVVRKTPSWWTPLRLLSLSALLLAVLAVVLFWVWQLRRQVRRKTQELAAEMSARRDAAIEFQAAMRERNRLAANLHDTLLQNMTGLSYQLEACEAESIPVAERPANHLETARRMVARAQDDLRGTVWALRILPLKEKSFREALDALARRLGEGHAETITVASEGVPVPMSEFATGDLLLVAQEGICNALKHARASRIDVHVAFGSGGDKLTLSLSDDGVGFSQTERAAKAADHFGLDGMRERVELLGGRFTIESQKGRGTVIRAEVPLRDYDNDLS